MKYLARRYRCFYLDEILWILWTWPENDWKYLEQTVPGRLVIYWNLAPLSNRAVSLNNIFRNLWTYPDNENIVNRPFEAGWWYICRRYECLLSLLSWQTPKNLIKVSRKWLKIPWTDRSRQTGDILVPLYSFAVSLKKIFRNLWTYPENENIVNRPFEAGWWYNRRRYIVLLFLWITS